MNSTAIITGAGSGIGRATALRFAAAGWQLMLTGRSDAKLKQTLSEIGSEASTKIHAADLTDPLACDHLIHATDLAFGSIDAICNIAGYAALAPISKTTAGLWRSTIDINLSAIVYLTHAAWPVLQRQASGVIVNISSMASIDPFPGFAAYAAAKAGLNMFTRVTANEGAAIGIKAVGIAPGAVETPLLRSLFSEAQLPPSAALPPQHIAGLIFDCVTGKHLFESGATLTVEP